MPRARWVRARSFGLLSVLVLATAACNVPGGGTPPTVLAPALTVTAPDAPLACGDAPAFPLTCTGTTTVTVKNTGTAPTSVAPTFDPVPGASRDDGCAVVLDPQASCTTTFTITDGFAALPLSHTATVRATAGTASGSDTFAAVAQVAVLQVVLGTPRGITIPSSVTGSVPVSVGVGCSSLAGYDFCVWNHSSAVVRNVGTVPTTAPTTFTKSGFINTPPPCAAGLAPNASCSLVADVPLSSLDPGLSGSVTAGPTAGAFDQTSPYAVSGYLTATSTGAIGHTATFSVSD